jgi:hypothetical protein
MQRVEFRANALRLKYYLTSFVTRLLRGGRI